jgi:cytochrome c-L
MAKWSIALSENEDESLTNAGKYIGMFETIWAGTNGGMGAKGIGLMDATDPKNGVTVDELLKVIAWIRTQGSGGVTGNE